MVHTRSGYKADNQTLASLNDDFFKRKHNHKRRRPHSGTCARPRGCILTGNREKTKMCFKVKRKDKRVKNASQKLAKRVIRFAAFNIQIFGDAKIADKFVREKLVDIFTQVTQPEF